MDGFLRLTDSHAWLKSKLSYSGPIEITAVARTNSDEIRLSAGRGGVLIFDWRDRKGELRIHRPDDLTKGELGSLAVSKQAPLAPNTWYVLRWLLTENGMAVSVNGQVVFTETAKFDLSAKRPVGISQCLGSVVDVKALSVKAIK